MDQHQQLLYLVATVTFFYVLVYFSFLKTAHLQTFTTTGGTFRGGSPPVQNNNNYARPFGRNTNFCVLFSTIAWFDLFKICQIICFVLESPPSGGPPPFGGIAPAAAVCHFVLLHLLLLFDDFVFVFVNYVTISFCL
jgi:hypothetical protein